jgi:sulfate adenylyltransferase subunit 2
VVSQGRLTLPAVDSVQTPRQEPDPIVTETMTREMHSPISHLEMLEAEAIHIIREVAATAENPVMLYSVGKDSGVMLHLARKAFYPSPPPFPLLHIDTTWDFQDVYEFRDRMASDSGMELIVHSNPEGVAQNVGPFTHGSKVHIDMMAMQALKQALSRYGFDAAFGGARRDEERSRAKERVFSFRDRNQGWDPKNQRPELWNLYNGRVHKGESIRVFPLSNWTELDIWQYIHAENIPMVPLYFAAERPVIERDGALIVVDDSARLPADLDRSPIMKRVRFRSLGCWPLTGAVESSATTLLEVIEDTLKVKNSERQGRSIDRDPGASMEEKKRQGYF